MKKDRTSAGKLPAKPADDPEFRHKMREKEAEWKRRAQIMREDEKGLVAECCATGVQINSVWDFVNRLNSYPEAIPVLVAHLDKEHHCRVREGIVRALINPESRGVAFAKLFELFVGTEDGDSEMKGLLGMALAEAATSDDADTVIRLANDQSHGEGREFLPFGLVDLPKGVVLPVLTGWISDPVLGKYSRKAIMRLRVNGRPDDSLEHRVRLR